MLYTEFLEKINDEWTKIQEYKVQKPNIEMAKKFEIWISPESEFYLVEIWDSGFESSIKIYKNIEFNATTS